MTLVAKISVQEKIAELESRIAALEKREQSRHEHRTHDVSSQTASFFDTHLGMWREFSKAMDKIFGRTK